MTISTVSCQGAGCPLVRRDGHGVVGRALATLGGAGEDGEGAFRSGEDLFTIIDFHDHFNLIVPNIIQNHVAGDGRLLPAFGDGEGLRGSGRRRQGRVPGNAESIVSFPRNCTKCRSYAFLRRTKREIEILLCTSRTMELF